MHGWLLRTVGAALVIWLAGCGPGDGAADSGGDPSCLLEVAVGQASDESAPLAIFAPFSPDDPAEIVLGFQGFLMLKLALRVAGTSAPTVNISASVDVESTGSSSSQITRHIPLVGGTVDEYLFFFNDLTAAQITNQPAELNVIVRAGDCVGTAQVRIELRDDDACIDFSVIVDAGVPDADPDAGLDAGPDAGADGGSACEGAR